MSEDRTRAAVIDAIRTHLGARGIEPALVIEDASFTQELDADSLTLQTLAQDLEDQFDVRIGPGDAVELQTVGQAVEFVLGYDREAAVR